MVFLLSFNQDLHGSGVQLPRGEDRPGVAGAVRTFGDTGRHVGLPCYDSPPEPDAEVVP